VSTVTAQPRSQAGLATPVVVATPCAYMDELRAALTAASPEPLTVITDPEQVEALEHGTSPVVVIIPSPGSAASAAAAQLSDPPRAGLWYAARCMAAAAKLARRSGARVLSHADLRQDPAGAIGRVLGELGLSVAPQPSTVGQSLLDAVQRTAGTPAGPLDIYAHGLPKGGSVGWWGPEHFWWGDDHAAALPERIDVTGAARTLVFGPLTALPAGRWRIRVRFALCADAARSGYILYFGGGRELEMLGVQPSGAGDYEIALENSWDDVGSADFRLALMRPAFHGELRFLGAQIEALD
jgi:hypothetical protein